MTGSETPLGCAALLRVAGLPIRFWLAGANPELFAQVRELLRRQEEQHAQTRLLAERVGREVVPHPGLTRADRALVLAVRRLLHRGEPVPVAQHRRVSRIASALSELDAGLLTALGRAADRERDLAARAARLAAAIGDEQLRLHRLPGQILAGSAVARELLPGGGTGRRDPGPDRRQVDHAWRRVTRAATACTPRDWLSHVALLPVTAGAARLSTVAVGAEFAARWTENVRSRRRELLGQPPAPDTALGLTPLHWYEDERLVAVVLDQHDEPVQVSVRRTPSLDAVVAALAAGPRTADRLSRALGQPGLGEFLRHLVTLGILQPAAPPRSRLVRPAAPGRPVAPAGPAGWVDVYRCTEAALPGDAGRELERGVRQALRVLALMTADLPAAASPPAAGDGRPWPVTDLLRAQLAAGVPRPPHQHTRLDWLEPAAAGSGYQRLVRTLAGRLAAGRLDPATGLDIDRALLDQLGAPDDPLDWPVDCLLRVPAPGAGYAAVLEQLWPPGTVDARFAEALRDLHGRVPQVDAYRSFLRRLEETTGLLFVELLAPPLSDGAANAVRRPCYTRAWTGDPHATGYLPEDQIPERYLPLAAIQVRRVAGRLRAEAGGQLLWPVHHATRSFSPPWDQLGAVLLATAPRTSRWAYRRPDDPLALFPGAPSVPRLTVGGQLVLSPAQWRLSPAEIWKPGEPVGQKVRALVRLQQRRGLPRWVSVTGSPDDPPLALDLESLHAIRALERCRRSGSPVRVVELLPAPDQLLVSDRAHQPGDQLASELLLRLPCDETPTAMADRLAPAILASIGLPAGHSGRSPPPRARCRGPPGGCADSRPTLPTKGTTMTSPEGLARISELDSRIRELEARVVRVPSIGLGGEAAHTNCESKGCTNCRGDGLVNVLLPGEETPLSGADLVAKLRTTRSVQ